MLIKFGIHIASVFPWSDIPAWHLYFFSSFPGGIVFWGELFLNDFRLEYIKAKQIQFKKELSDVKKTVDESQTHVIPAPLPDTARGI